MGPLLGVVGRLRSCRGIGMLARLRRCLLSTSSACPTHCPCRIQAVASGPGKAASQASGSEKDGASSIGDGQSSMGGSSEVGCLEAWLGTGCMPGQPVHVRAVPGQSLKPAAVRFVNPHPSRAARPRVTSSAPSASSERLVPGRRRPVWVMLVTAPWQQPGHPLLPCHPLCRKLNRMLNSPQARVVINALHK